MATEQQKQAALAHIEARVRIAEDQGFHATARSWRDYHATLATRDASEIVIAKVFGNDIPLEY